MEQQATAQREHANNGGRIPRPRACRQGGPYGSGTSRTSCDGADTAINLRSSTATIKARSHSYRLRSSMPRTKHIDVAAHDVRELAKDYKISLHYIQTDKMLADMLTKPLERLRHSQKAEQAGLRTLFVRSRGSVETTWGIYRK